MVSTKQDEVIIEHGEERIIVPRKVYDATRQAEKDPRFVSAISRTFQAIQHDPTVRGIGLIKNMDDPKPEVLITREAIDRVVVTPAPEPETRIVTEVVDLQILKAILERSARKWEFMWRGVKISAPITCSKFYNDFSAHDITIAPGDMLRSRLAIRQRRDSSTGIYSNEDYEVVEVFTHIPRLRQPRLPEAGSGE